MMNTLALCYMLFLGISVSANIRIGNMLGANKPNHAKLIMKIGFCLSFACSLCTSVLIIFGRSYLAEMYINDSSVIQ